MDSGSIIESRILNENKTVHQLYKDLVMSGLVVADDFWMKYVDVSAFCLNVSSHTHSHA